ncbi:MAG: endonuclease/exonuclease/phosphatase family protein [SAR324 cluster bacterium]|nr:endonuclease/exonuclease/phosphatase family protein [SAR324 cluster bacterium]
MEKISTWIITLSAFFLSLLSIIYLLNQKSPEPATPAETLKVMTYNIHQGFNNAGKVDPTLFLRAIQTENPDLLGLQESDTNRVISSNYDLVRWLANKLGMYSYFGPKTKDNIYGVALLSKYPLEKTNTIFLESVADQRVVIEAHVQYQGTSVHVMVAHLGLSVEDRFNQTRYLWENVLKKLSEPTILMGDFNTVDWEDFADEQAPLHHQGSFWYSHHHKEYEDRLAESRKKHIMERAAEAGFHGMSSFREYMTDTWRLMNPGNFSAFTWFDTNEKLGVPYERLSPSVRIDYVYASDHFKVIESHILNDRNTLQASDHLPLISHLKFDNFQKL